MTVTYKFFMAASEKKTLYRFTVGIICTRRVLDHCNSNVGNMESLWYDVLGYNYISMKYGKSIVKWNTPLIKY